MVYLTLQDPYYSHFFQNDQSIANMQMNDVVDFELNNTMVIAKYEADEWNRYAKKDEFFDFKAQILRDKIEHNISSKKAIYENEMVNFQDNVDYKNSDGLRLISDYIVYNTNSKVIQSDTNFTMTRGKNRVIGRSLKYDLNTKQLLVSGINAVVQQERKK
jgi:hypothetical protein